MTTNQTIDGVPREPEWCEALLKLEVVREALTSRDSAERLRNMDAGKVLREGIAILKELRALLNAKPETVAGHHSACRAVDDYKPGECSHSCKPASKIQGDPVAIPAKPDVIIDGVPILPCPFCGSAPIEQHWLPEGCGTGDVVCSNDDCAIGGIDGIPYEQWNKRPGEVDTKGLGAFTLFPGDIQSIGSEGMVIADSTGKKIITAEWCEFCDKSTPHEKRCSCCKPAAQPQGEPVAWRGCNADGEVVTDWIDGVPPERMTDLCGNPATFDKIERAYAKQPAPVAQKYDDTLLPFVALMRKELHANDGKGDRPGWLSMSTDTCLLEIIYHFGKLQASVKRGDEDGIREYAADVANMCMMLSDICNLLETK